jgi:hypothetical protein
MTLTTGEAIELIQTGSDVASTRDTDHEGDDGEFEVYHDALGDQPQNPGNLSANVHVLTTKPAAFKKAFKRLKKFCLSFNVIVIFIITIGAFTIGLFTYRYAVWTADKDYYEYCYERNVSMEASRGTTFSG